MQNTLAKMRGCFGLNRDREGIQTPNLLIRSETLYSVELRSQLIFFVPYKQAINQLLLLKSGAKISKTFTF